MARRIIRCDGMYIQTSDVHTIHLVDMSYSLFDMDGTLVDSTPGVVGAWNNLRKTYPHLDVQAILSCEDIFSFLFILKPHCVPSIAWHSHYRKYATTSRDRRS